MSDDLISREDVLKLLYEIKDDNSIPKNYGTILDIINRVRELPASAGDEKYENEIQIVVEEPVTSSQIVRKIMKGKIIKKGKL